MQVVCILGLSKGSPSMRDQTKCGKCGEPRDYAIKSGRRAGKLHTYCRKCLYGQVADWTRRNHDHALEKQRAWWAANPERKIRSQMRRYGVDEKWYLAKLEEQNNVCAICGNQETKRGTSLDRKVRRLSADHCHKTGALRGLLCVTCNTRVATLEVHDWLPHAMDYLQKYAPCRT
jgi:hypothetical protein